MDKKNYINRNSVQTQYGDMFANSSEHATSGNFHRLHGMFDETNSVFGESAQCM